MDFSPDYRNLVDVTRNRRPARLPLYEHTVSAGSMEKILDVRFADLEQDDARDRAEFFRQYCRFFQEMTYDKVLDAGRRFRRSAKGYALGSGNSIPDYVPTENYLAMIRAAQTLRQEEMA